METKENKRRPPAPTAGRPRQKKAVETRGNVAVKQKQKRRPPSAKKPTPDVVYTPPGPFNRNRFLLQLASVIAVVLALLFGMSIFFKVDGERITVSGNEKYSAWQVREASGIQDGENLLTVSQAKISSSIIAALPYVEEVRVGIKLPDTVKIEIVELDVVYAVEAQDSSWWLMRADGGIIEKTTAADAQGYTRVLGVKVTDPQVGQKAAAYQPVSEETTADGQPVPVTVNAAQQLEAAISVLQYLEDNGVIGEAASVDVTNLGSLEMWYEDRFQIILGDSTQMSYKIGLAKGAISELEAYDSGVLDVSLTVQPDSEKAYQVIFTPFE